VWEVGRMLGVRSAQRGLLEADHLYLDYVGRGTFYGFLASMRGELFRDEEFAELYCPDNGRDSASPTKTKAHWPFFCLSKASWYRRETSACVSRCSSIHQVFM